MGEIWNDIFGLAFATGILVYFHHLARRSGVVFRYAQLVAVGAAAILAVAAWIALSQWLDQSALSIQRVTRRQVVGAAVFPLVVTAIICSLVRDVSGRSLLVRALRRLVVASGA